MKKLAFIGLGNMGRAIASGIIKSGALAAENVYGYAPHWDRLEAYARETGIHACRSALAELVKESYILLERIFPYKDAGMLQLIRREGQLLEEEYLADGIRVKANVPVELYGRLS